MIFEFKSLRDLIFLATELVIFFLDLQVVVFVFEFTFLGSFGSSSQFLDFFLEALVFGLETVFGSAEKTDCFLEFLLVSISW